MIARAVRHLLGQPAPAPLPLPEGVSLVAGRWLPALGGWFAGTGRPAAAVTIGSTIVVHPEAKVSEALLRHELAHVRQWRERPWTFAVRYAVQHLRYGYRDNPYEVEARKAETGDAGG